MTVLQAVILGIVQGLTEFLPVSSSGHLVLAQSIMGIGEDAVFFDVMLHAGTLVAVLVVFYKDIIALFNKPYKNMWLLILATLPSVVIMLIFNDVIESLFSGSMLSFGFFATAVILAVTEYVAKRTDRQRLLNADGALYMGLAQAVAVMPGISRSGSTICAGLLYGLDRKTAAKFSFLMSVVIISGSALYKLIGGGTGNSVGTVQIIAGMVTAAVSGYASVRLMLKAVDKINFKWFSLYLTVLSIITFVDGYLVNLW